MRAALAIACAMAGSAAAGPAVQAPSAQPSPEERAYVASVGKALDATWQPQQIFDDHLQGRNLGPWFVVLQVSIAADGELKDVSVTRSSGLQAFDDEAIRAFRAVPRFAPPPSGIVDPKLATYSFPFTPYVPGWAAPTYLGDPYMRSPDTHSWLVGSSITGAWRDTTTSGSYARLSRLTAEADASYRMTDHALLEIVVPYETLRFHEPSGARREMEGFGDGTLHVHGLGRRGGWYLSYFLGARLPLGASEAMPVVGTQVPTIVQLGSGTVDPDIGACGFRILADGREIGACDHARMAVYSNRHGFRDGFAFDARLFVQRSFVHRQLGSYAAFVFAEQQDSVLSGAILPGSGSTEVFVEENAWFWIIRGLSIYAGASLWLYRSGAGNHAFDNRRLTAGATWNFDLP